MKFHVVLAVAAALTLVAVSLPSLADETDASVVYETATEFFSGGNFQGSGQTDIVIVDKESGKYRLGYQLTPGVFTWVDCRPSNLRGVGGFSVGKVLDKGMDGLVFAAPDANQIVMLEASNTNDPGRPTPVPFTDALGANMLVAMDIGGAGKAGLADFYVSSIYNSPDANQATLIRNDGTTFPKIADAPLSGLAAHGNRLAIKSGQPEFLCLRVQGEKGSAFHVEDLSFGSPKTVADADGLPPKADYAAGYFRGSPLRDFVFYQPGASNLLVRAMEEPEPGKFRFGKEQGYDMGMPVRRVVALNEQSAWQLLVIFGAGEKAGVFNFDGTRAPVAVQSIQATNELFTFAKGLPGGFILFAEPATGKFSTRYYIYKAGQSAFASFGGLASLADNDNIAIPDIYGRIVADSTAKDEADMKPYTNTIPGTRVTYAMVPIPGGEFVMGSPDGEASRKPDEGPQHKVKVSPFWMEKCEVTWNEYELFMYPDEEHRMRAMAKTDEAGDRLADIVTHPSKPYVEMSFGMGKDGYPAISMTQHAANKYCQWLSAKTGHFYRLPTEAEWEYAARAGTTNAYFFGDNPANLGQYGWFEDNSDFKYQKAGKKLSNPWGLYDMCGNVDQWVLDQYDPDFYTKCAAMGEVTDPWNKATKPYPHSARGGSWDDGAALCRSAARRGSERAWKMQDPQLPKSIWFLSDAQFVGFRIVRPLKVPTAAQMQKYWTSGVEKD